MFSFSKIFSCFSYLLVSENLRGSCVLRELCWVNGVSEFDRLWYRMEMWLRSVCRWSSCRLWRKLWLLYRYFIVSLHTPSLPWILKICRAQDKMIVLWIFFNINEYIVTGLVHTLHSPIMFNAEVYMLPYFDMKLMLESVALYKIEEVNLVPRMFPISLNWVIHR